MMETDPMDLTEGLPHDLLANVLGRLRPSPRSLAATRCVCKAWCAVVDTHRLLTDLLPHSLAGLFVQVGQGTLPRQFSLVPPTEIAAFDYLDTQGAQRLTIRQHCNGLLLLGDDEEARVLNPATRQWATLPPPPPMYTPGLEDAFRANSYIGCHDQFLVFDPTVSPHYEVFSIKYVPDIPCLLLASYIKEREWPPSTFVFLVLSSRTNQWEERTFVRQGETARTIEYMIEAFPSKHPYAVYGQGALYIRQYDFVMRLTLSSHKYQVLIELPESLQQNWFACRLGKSKNGVYSAVLFRDHDDGLRLQIYYLEETCDQINWMLKCDVKLHPVLSNFSKAHSASPSNKQCANGEEDGTSNATVTNDRLKHSHVIYSLLGFHPSEEIVFFHTPLKRVVAYHFDSTKIEDLGSLPNGSQDGIYLSFPYTPCWITEFSRDK